MAHVPTSTTTSNDLLNHIIDLIWDLDYKQNLIQQAEETLSAGKFLNVKQKAALRSKSVVAHHMNLLEKLDKEMSSGQLSLKSQLLNASASTAVLPIKEADKTDPSASPADQPSVQASESTGKSKAGEFRSSMDKRETREVANLDERHSLGKPKFLCVSDGLVICCLELKQSNHRYEDVASVPALSKAPTLKMVEGGRLISAGLFKLGFNAYVIGGQVLPEHPHPVDVSRCRYPWGLGRYESLLKKHGLDGLSRSIEGLSVDDDGILSVRGCRIPNLEDPKIWPIVEKIDGIIHVISSFPRAIFHCYSDEESSHEFLNLYDSKGWTKIPSITHGRMRGIYSHLVVGSRIYALGSRGFMMFDSKTEQWEEIEHNFKRKHPSRIRRVWQLLHAGKGRCAGEFPIPPGESIDDSLFVVIAIVWNVRTVDTLATPAWMVAYLVTSAGVVLCYQCLRDFFFGELQPTLILASTVINVDEMGKTMCVVVNGKSFTKIGEMNNLFINTFSVEGIAEAYAKVPGIWKEMKMGRDPPIELEFVRVHVEDRYIYKMDEKLETSDLVEIKVMQACFP